MHSHEQIAMAAYYLWLANPESDPDDNWNSAAAQLSAPLDPAVSEPASHRASVQLESASV
jgi:hypothetical protein